MEFIYSLKIQTICYMPLKNKSSKYFMIVLRINLYQKQLILFILNHFNIYYFIFFTNNPSYHGPSVNAHSNADFIAIQLFHVIAHTKFNKFQGPKIFCALLIINISILFSSHTCRQCAAHDRAHCGEEARRHKDSHRLENNLSIYLNIFLYF